MGWLVRPSNMSSFSSLTPMHLPAFNLAVTSLPPSHPAPPHPAALGALVVSSASPHPKYLLYSIVKSSHASYLSTWPSLYCWQCFSSLSQGGYRRSKHHLTSHENIEKQEEKGKPSLFITEKNPSKKPPSRFPLLPRRRSESHSQSKSSLGK